MTIHNAERPVQSMKIEDMNIYLAEKRPLSHDQGLPLHEGPPVNQHSPEPSPRLWLQRVILCMQPSLEQAQPAMTTCCCNMSN